MTAERTSQPWASDRVPNFVAVRPEDFKRLVHEKRYKGENPPPWIRLDHGLVFDDPTFQNVSPTARFVYVAMLLLSVRYRNHIPTDQGLLYRQLNVKRPAKYLEMLLGAGLLAPCRPFAVKSSAEDQPQDNHGTSSDTERVSNDRPFMSFPASRLLAQETDGGDETEETGRTDVPPSGNGRTEVTQCATLDAPVGALAPRRERLRLGEPADWERRRTAQKEALRLWDSKGDRQSDPPPSGWHPPLAWPVGSAVVEEAPRDA